MTANLIYRSGSRRGQRITLNQDLIRLGRKSNNHIVLNDEIVSSNHAEIHRREDDYYLVDLESTNGTFVNGKTVHRITLNDRDEIQFVEGGPILEFSHEAREEVRPSRICPLSGHWEKGMDAVALEHSRITIGRGIENNIVVGRVPDSTVSVHHAVITGHSGEWELEDLQSSNGTFVNGELIQKGKLHDGDRVKLGSGGPEFEFKSSQAQGKQNKGSSSESERLLRKLERASKGGKAGEETMVMLQAAQKYYKRRRWPLLIVSGIILAVALTTGYLYYREKQRNAALSQFYNWRKIEAQFVQNLDEMTPDEIARKTSEREKAERDYEKFLDKLGVYKGKTPVQKAIMRLARRLGETDLEMPSDFYQETMNYVDIWRRSSILKDALDRARRRNLPQIIGTALKMHGLPRELFFLPLQESGYDNRAVGQPTRFGIAKGLWQMIPPTAEGFHLKIGPLKDKREYDPDDERHNELRSTEAAVRYLADIFSTKAAASGLLAIASYNYGETRVIRKLDTLPNDPRQRNFWNFHNNGWLPDETRKYVMKIFSAALICENPELFQVNIEPILLD
jgi:membrane-bound lytic murein transglycosylase D